MSHLHKVLLFVLMPVLLLTSGGNWLYGKPRNEIRPNFCFSLTPRFYDDTNAFSFLGEVGENILRLNGTGGCYFNSVDRIKFGGEYLGEKLIFQFEPKNVKTWVNQYAVGGVYQHIYDCWGVYSFDIGGRFSHCQNKHLSSVTTPVNTNTVQPQKTYSQRIAGSNAWDAQAGFTLIPWDSSLFTLAAVYDHVKYDKRYNLSDKIDSGAGAILRFVQTIVPNVTLGARGEFRCPYTYIGMDLNWRIEAPKWGGMVLGVYGGHTRGRRHLPDSTLAGLQLSFDFGIENVAGNICESSWEHCYDKCWGNPECEYLAWLAEPAVYMPQVLAKSDFKVVQSCAAPTSMPIPNFTAPGAAPFYSFVTVLSGYFNNQGNALTYTASIISSGTVTNPSVSIDPTTGQLIVGGSSPGTLTIQVTGTNTCGSTSKSFAVTFTST